MYYILDNHSHEGPIMQPEVYDDMDVAMTALQKYKDWCPVADFQVRIDNQLPEEEYIDLRTRRTADWHNVNHYIDLKTGAGKEK